jgi:tetratricopeptide (TPR) repeat protein
MRFMAVLPLKAQAFLWDSLRKRAGDLAARHLLAAASMPQTNSAIVENPRCRVTSFAPTLLSQAEELALIEKAYAAAPESAELGARLGMGYFALDQFDKAIGLLETHCAHYPEPEPLHALGLCLLSRENEADTIRSMEFTRRAAEISTDRRLASNALAAFGKAQWRLDRVDEARASFRAALDRYPNNKDAFKRLAMLDFGLDRPEEVLRLANETVANGVFHARALAMVPLALARLGRIEEARAANGLDRFFTAIRPAAPEGWSSIEDFNRDLAAELMRHPGRRFGRYGAASTQSWRVDDPSLVRFKAVNGLKNMLAATVENFVNSLPAGPHPWLRGMPRDAGLHGWAVISEGEGYEEWHVHQNAWLSGAYYIEVPDNIVEGETNAGCVGFGLPEAIVGEEAQRNFGIRIVRPEAGLLTIFPSHCFHRTYSYSGGARRICFAFDVTPPLPELPS